MIVTMTTTATMTEKEFAQIIYELNGRAYLVGGAVRDKFMQRQIHDKDYCITGVTLNQFVNAFPQAKLIGKSFPVYLLNIDGEDREVAFARTEIKNGIGYHSFKIQYDSLVTIEQDLYRRDTTMNAIAIDLLTGEIIDPYDGLKDINQRCIRAVSHHFKDDPTRALRAARQAVQFDFNITNDTIKLMSECKDELTKEPGERIFAELVKILSLPTIQSSPLSKFFRILDSADLLQSVFPEIYNLKGKTQLKLLHPEGDAYKHSLLMLDEVAMMTNNPITRFAALFHDIGKSTTSIKELPHHYYHEIRGLKVFKTMCERLPIPTAWQNFTSFVIYEHMRVRLFKQPKKIVDFLMRVYKQHIDINEFNKIVIADYSKNLLKNGVYQLPIYLSQAEELIQMLLTVTGENVPENLVVQQIGAWIRQQRISLYKRWLKQNSNCE